MASIEISPDKPLAKIVELAGGNTDSTVYKEGKIAIVLGP